MTAATPDGRSARATLLEALDAYLDAVKAAATHTIEAQPTPESGEVRGLAVFSLLETSGAATALAGALLEGAHAVPANALLAPAVQAAIAGALTVPPEQARDWARQARAAAAGIKLPGSGS